MKIIIGLGNPEKDYKGTRHNVGFEVIDNFSKVNNVKVNKLKFKAFVGEGFFETKKIILLKPQTYMNLSGNSVKEILQFYKLNENDIIVIYDDISLPVGQIRIREKGSSAGHNGIKSIIDNLGTDEFLRIRLGIGEKPKNYILSDYVLSGFSKAEQLKIDEGILDATDAIEILLKNDVNTAMNKFNKKNRGESM